MFSRYFQEELTYLREAGREFSRGNPQLAPLLADTSADPSVERLLEGVAFLTSRIREKLDDELPEFVNAMGLLLFPHLLRPLPSACIVELLPHLTTLREAMVVPRDTEFGTVPTEGVTCRFRATAPTTLIPWEIEKARVESIPGNRQQIRLEVRLASPQVVPVLAGHPARFHLAAERRTALDILKHLHENLEDIVIAEPDPQGRPAREHSIGKQGFRLVGWNDDEALLFHDRRLFPGYRLLQEYYTLPEKFAFFDIEGIGRGMRGGDRVDRYDILLRTKGTVPSGGGLDKEWIRLHCVPAVNLFATSTDPVRLNNRQARFRLRVANMAPPHGIVYAVTNVHHIPHGSNERVPIPFFYDFAHAGKREGRGASAMFYELDLARSMVGDGMDSFISFGTPRDRDILPDSEVVSVDIVATNGRVASNLPVGDVRVIVPSSPSVARFRSITATTPYVAIPTGRELAWRMVAQASMGLRSLAEPDVLRALMETHNFHALVDRQAARSNELRIEALKSIAVKPVERMFKGAPVRGVAIDILAEEEGFLGEGDLFLFSAVLDRLFADYVSLNSFSRVSVTAASTSVKFQWPARTGKTTLL